MNRRGFLATMGAALAAAALGGWRRIADPPRRTCRWRDGAEGDWADHRNWEGGQAPAYNDDVVIMSGHCHISGDCRIRTLTLGGGCALGGTGGTLTMVMLSGQGMVGCQEVEL